ncbi:MAG: IPT/TIG domain-containing protein [bacterium]|nr:IPT/TIG domain-containing protein [bacterium]
MYIRKVYSVLILIVILLGISQIGINKEAKSALYSFSSDTLSGPGIRSNRVLLFQATPYEVRPGGEVTLVGSGFSKTENRVLIGDKVGIFATSTNGTEIRFKIPSNFKENTYKITVFNQLGSSTNPVAPVLVKVTKKPQSPPSVSSATIEGGVITISGSGFSESNNIYTNMGSVEKIKLSKRKTLSFSIASLTSYSQAKNSLKGAVAVFPLSIFIQNEHGISQVPYNIDITI